MTAPLAALRTYLARLSAGRLVLWCYFVWWIAVVAWYFDRDLRIWLTSLGLSAIIGVALLINTTLSGSARLKLEAWPTFRLFVTPFCVSSFSALARGHGFWLIFPTEFRVLFTGLAAVAGFCAIVFAARRTGKMHFENGASPSGAAEPH